MTITITITITLAIIITITPILTIVIAITTRLWVESCHAGVALPFLLASFFLDGLYRSVYFWPSL